MRRSSKQLPLRAWRELERRVESEVFGRSGARAPRYSTDRAAGELLLARLQGLGFLLQLESNGLVVDDLCLGTSYFYGISETTPERLFVRSALFLLEGRSRLRGSHPRFARARVVPRRAVSARPRKVA
jgi:hypothetical protein